MEIWAESWLWLLVVGVVILIFGIVLFELTKTYEEIEINVWAYVLMGLAIALILIGTIIAAVRYQQTALRN